MSLLGNQTMQVEILMDTRIIRDVEIHPNPFTPNGDGINDETTISFSVFRIFTQRTVEVSIYDDSGRRMRQLMEMRDTGSGRYDIVWDGKSKEGRRMRPGVYVVRIHVPEEYADHDTYICSVGVAY